MAGPDESNINALLARGVGPAMLEGAHAGYYMSKTQQEAEQERRRLAVQPDVQPALRGDKAAQARVFANDPKAGALLEQTLTRMDANQRAQAKDWAQFTGMGSDMILKLPPSERGPAYKNFYDEAVRRGYDPTGWTPEYTPEMEGRLRTHRGLSLDVLKHDQQMELKKTPPGKAAGGGGGNGEVWGGSAPGPQSSAAPAIPPTQTADVAPPPAGNVQTAAYMPPAPTASQFTRPDANMNVAPPTVPPQDDPDVIRGLPPVPPVQQAQAGPPPGWQPMGHRDPQGNLVPAYMDGKPVFRNVQTGELTSNPQAVEPVPALSSGGTNAQGPGGGLPPGGPQGALPPGIQMAKSGDRYAPKIVFDDPGERGGVYGTQPGEKGKRAIITGPGGGALYKMPDGTFEEYKPELKAPKSAAPAGYEQDPTAPGRLRPIPGGPADKAAEEIDQTLRGQALLDAVKPDEARAVVAIDEGRAELPKLSGRMSPEDRRLRKLVFQYDPTFDDTVHAARQKTQIDFATGDLSKQIANANKLIGHIGDVHEVSAELNNSDIPLFNKAGNIIAANRGDPRIAKFNVAKHLALEEADKFFSGTGGTTVSGMEEMRKLINDAQSPQQLQGAMEQMQKMLVTQLSSMANKYNNGMKYTGDKRLKPEEILSEDARAGLKRITENPLKGPGERARDDYNKTGEMPRIGADGSGYDAIPAGSTYIAPDGSVRTKGGK